MKLGKCQNKQVIIKRKTIVLIVLVCVLSYGIFFYQSYENQDKVLSNDFSGSTEFAFYNGIQKLDTIPLKESGVLYVGSKCTNGATVKWDYDAWVPSVYNLKKAKTSCTLYFGDEESCVCAMYPEGAACKYYKAGETEEILYDDTEDKNLRFVGATPNNYVYFNCEDGVEASVDTCETWRIIGIMNNIEDEYGGVGSHLKIIRDPFDIKYSWDSSATKINGGYGINEGRGVNEWSTSAIEKVLNDEYLYRRTGSNLCYKDENNTIENCLDWPNIGIRETSRNMISSVKWNTGTIDEAWTSSFYNNAAKFNAKAVYMAERGNHTGKEQCQASGSYGCNDKVDRTTTWTGKVGLMYPSDYGYAVGTEVRETCLKKSMYTYYSDNCKTNDWLRDANNSYWTITPVPSSSYASGVLNVNSSGYVTYYSTYYAHAVRPTLYLASSVKIMDGSGEAGDPFILGM